MKSIGRRKFVGIGAVGCLAAFLQPFLRERGVESNLPKEEIHRGGVEEELQYEGGLENDDVEYQGNDTVRIVQGISGGQSVTYRTVPFEEWAEHELGNRAATEVANHVQEAFDRNEPWEVVRFNYGVPIDSSSDSGVLVEYAFTVIDGELESKPDIDYQTLIDSTPRTVSAMLEVEGQTYEATFPVWVQKVVKKRWTQ